MIPRTPNDLFKLAPRTGVDEAAAVSAGSGANSIIKSTVGLHEQSASLGGQSILPPLTAANRTRARADESLFDADESFHDTSAPRFRRMTLQSEEPGMNMARARFNPGVRVAHVSSTRRMSAGISSSATGTSATGSTLGGSSLGNSSVAATLTTGGTNLGVTSQSAGSTQSPLQQPTPAPTAQPAMRIGDFSFVTLSDGSTEVRRLRKDVDERVATIYAQGNDQTVIFDGPQVEQDWHSLLGELFLFTTAPALAGRYDKTGFELNKIPSGSVLLASGIRQGDVLVDIDGVPVVQVKGDTLPLTAAEGHVNVTVRRDNKNFSVALVQSSSSVKMAMVLDTTSANPVPSK